MSIISYTEKDKTYHGSFFTHCYATPINRTIPYFFIRPSPQISINLGLFIGSNLNISFRLRSGLLSVLFCNFTQIYFFKLLCSYFKSCNQSSYLPGKSITYFILVSISSPILYQICDFVTSIFLCFHDILQLSFRKKTKIIIKKNVLLTFTQEDETECNLTLKDDPTSFQNRQGWHFIEYIPSFHHITFFSNRTYAHLFAQCNSPNEVINKIVDFMLIKEWEVDHYKNHIFYFELLNIIYYKFPKTQHPDTYDFHHFQVAYDEATMFDKIYIRYLVSSTIMHLKINYWKGFIPSTKITRQDKFILAILFNDVEKIKQYLCT